MTSDEEIAQTLSDISTGIGIITGILIIWFIVYLWRWK